MSSDYPEIVDETLKYKTISLKKIIKIHLFI